MALEQHDIQVIRSILYDLYPPTNPAVILRAAREWYLFYGADAVYKAVIDWLYKLGAEDGKGLAFKAYDDAEKVFQRYFPKP